MVAVTGAPPRPLNRDNGAPLLPIDNVGDAVCSATHGPLDPRGITPRSSSMLARSTAILWTSSSPGVARWKRCCG
ncbi:hypothetical protein E2562_027906 [Oryza meyeriana var. granulata]|uniref:Uncharacterized protein n=1 Tax=Oryza meyeriana var. granulata TaxID=110450 RepID=A0A6G1EZS4_9ORYZ|nr:hypothetical protein E2562_027906 [Oryza meyeriana var. granulata]